MEEPLTLTDRAAAEIRAILAEHGLGPADGLRIYPHPDPGGGFAFVFQLAPEATPEDLVLELAGLRVVLDPDAARELSGVEVAFLDDLLNRGFVFQRPGEGAGEGCAPCGDPGIQV